MSQFEMNDVKILMEQGYEVHYASNFDNPVYELNKEELIRKGIRLHQIDICKSPIHLRHNLRAFWQLRDIMKQESFSAVHCHNPMGGVLGRLAARGCKKNEQLYVIYTAHGFHFYKDAPLFNWIFYYPVERLLARWTDSLITINKEDAKRAESFLHGRLKSIYQIPGVGVDTKRFARNSKERRKVRGELGMGEEIFHILSVGELNHNKNHEVLLHALALLRDPEIRLGICGKGYREQYLRKLTEELGLESQVTFFGFRHDIPRMLQSADCFCFPSIREGLGIAALEAMAAGVPMITSDCRGTREYMEDGVTGYVCNSGSTDEYAKLIKKMKENTGLRRTMSAVCRKRAENFDIVRTDRIMREIYQRMDVQGNETADSA